MGASLTIFLVAVKIVLSSLCNWNTSLPRVHTSVTSLIQYLNSLVCQGEPILAHSSPFEPSLKAD